MKIWLMRPAPILRLMAVLLLIIAGYLTGSLLAMLLLFVIITATGVLITSWGKTESSWVSLFTVAAATLAIVGGARIWHEENDYAIRSSLFGIQESFARDHPINHALSDGGFGVLPAMLTQLRDDTLTFVRAQATVYSLCRLGHRGTLSRMFFHGIERHTEDGRSDDIANIKRIREHARGRARATLEDLWEPIREACAPGSGRNHGLASTLLWLSGVELILAQASEENGEEIGSANEVAKWEAICEADVE